MEKEFVKIVKGPCVILAGAGTGKTTSIVDKIHYLLENKIYSPEKIVCITFSNEASNNLYSRIMPFVSGDNEPVIKTFHSFSADLLRLYGEKIGIKKDFKILTPDDAKIILHKYFKTRPRNCSDYVYSIGIAKDLGIKIKDFEKYVLDLSGNFNQEDILDIDRTIYNLSMELSTISKEASKLVKEKISSLKNLNDLNKFLVAWKSHEKIKILENYQDYSDLNNNALKLLREFPEVKNNFDYVIVDEFQDTNKVQLDFLLLLADHRNITVVGDLNQSIYMFRGAYSENLKVFKDYFNLRDESVFNLDKSYRSTNKILKVANDLIKKNYSDSSFFETLNAENIEGDNVEVYELKNAREEARKVCEIVESEIQSGVSMSEICVIYRNHQHGKLIKKLFEEKEIPFVSLSKKLLLEQELILRIINYLKLVDILKNNKRGAERILWEIFYNFNIEKKDLVNIGKKLKEIKDRYNFNEVIFDELKNLDVSYSTKMKISSINEKIKLFLDFNNDKVVDLIKEIFFVEKNDFDLSKSDILNFNKFVNLASNNLRIHFGELGNFVHYLEIIDNLDIGIEAYESENEGVRLMTAHSTKGLEYHSVIMTNMVQDKFPNENYKSNKLLPWELIRPEIKDKDESEKYNARLQIMEERRLCYVSFTRAKKRLFITYAKEYSKKEFLPSQFLKEVNYVDNPNINFIVDEEEKSFELEKPKVINPNLIFLTSNIEKTILDFPDNFSNLDIELSPSSILLFKDCQKKFEYKYVYNMPEKKPIFWEEIRLGSFVHLILSKGVRANLKSKEEFFNVAKELHREIDWEFIDIKEAFNLIDIFFKNNYGKYDENSKTEQVLKINLGGMNFVGFADRIDFGKNGLEIVDYKTGSSNIFGSSRNLQLGYYAIAAEKLGVVKKITLDLLRKGESVEFELKGNVAKSIKSNLVFNLGGIKKELVSQGEKILEALNNGFKKCSVEKNCSFCNELK